MTMVLLASGAHVSSSYSLTAFFALIGKTFYIHICPGIFVPTMSLALSSSYVQGFLLRILRPCMVQLMRLRYGFSDVDASNLV